MNNKLIERIDDYFKDPQSLTMEQMEQFVHETLKFFDTLRVTLTSGTEEEKKEALKKAQEMQKKLQEVAQKAYQKLGMNQEQINKFLAEGSFPKEQMKHFQNAQHEIADYQKTVLKNKATDENTRPT